jgi:hypothetical protein
MTDKVSYMHYVVSNMIVHLFCCCSKVKVGITYDVVKTCLVESDSENRSEKREIHFTSSLSSHAYIYEYACLIYMQL